MKSSLLRTGLLVGVLLLASVQVWSSEFVISFPQTRVQLNPIHSYTATEAQIYSGIHEGLVGYHPRTVESVPAIAERWEVSNDGLVYTFYLRDNAKYSNGDFVTAQHFRDTWLIIVDPETNSAYNFLFDIIEGVPEYRDGLKTEDFIGIRVIDKLTLQVTLRKPATHFLRILAHHSFVAVHPDVRDISDWSRLNTLPTNGAYQIAEKSTEKISLTYNPFYWAAEEVAIENITILFTEDNDDTVTEKYNRNEIDWATGGITLSELDSPSHIVINPLFATTYYFVNSHAEPFSDVKIRRALALLLPWENIRDPAIHFIPTVNLVPPIPFYPDVEGIQEGNTEEALRLLKEAGYVKGAGLPPIRIHIPVGEEPMRVAEIMKLSWEEALETTVLITTVQYPEYFDTLKRKNFTIGTISWIGDFADPLTFLQMWISDSNVNDAGFTEPQYDKLIEDSLRQSGVERYETLAEAEKLLLETGTVLPVSHSPSVNVINLKAIGGWHANPLDIHPLRYIHFTGKDAVPGAIRYDYR